MSQFPEGKLANILANFAQECNTQMINESKISVITVEL